MTAREKEHIGCTGGQGRIINSCIGATEEDDDNEARKPEFGQHGWMGEPKASRSAGFSVF
jgi:hypothetical protein